jgi:hypothetical protein
MSDAQPRQTRVLDRGEYLQPLDVVAPAVQHCLVLPR